MFSKCKSLSSLKNLKNWNTGKVDDMNNMFSECSALTSLEGLENWEFVMLEI